MRSSEFVDSFVRQLVCPVVLLCDVPELIQREPPAVPFAELAVEIHDVHILAVQIHVSLDTVEVDLMTLEERLEPWSGARALAEHEEELEPAGDFDALDLDGKLRRIEKVLDLKVRPNLAGDGGGVELMGLEDGVAYIHYVGACGSCPSAGTATLEFVRDALRTQVSPGLDVQLS